VRAAINGPKPTAPDGEKRKKLARIDIVQGSIPPRV